MALARLVSWLTGLALANERPGPCAFVRNLSVSRLPGCGHPEASNERLTLQTSQEQDLGFRRVCHDTNDLGNSHHVVGLLG